MRDGHNLLTNRHELTCERRIERHDHELTGQLKHFETSIHTKLILEQRDKGRACTFQKSAMGHLNSSKSGGREWSVDFIAYLQLICVMVCCHIDEIACTQPNQWHTNRPWQGFSKIVPCGWTNLHAKSQRAALRHVDREISNLDTCFVPQALSLCDLVRS